MKRALVLLVLSVFLPHNLSRSRNPGVDTATINRIRGEAVANSQAMDTHWWLSEAFGPRATGTPGYQQGADWVMKKFNEWGLKNIHIERFPVRAGLDHRAVLRSSADAVQPAPLDRHAAMVFAVDERARSRRMSCTCGRRPTADLAKYKGQLRGKIVVLQAPRPVRMLDGRVVLRMNDADWNEAMTLPAPACRSPRHRPAGPSSGAAIRAGRCSDSSSPKARRSCSIADRDGDLSAGGSDLSWQTQRVDGGTIFPGNGGSRDPKAPQQVPSATLAVEHYNRIVRLLERGQPVRMEVNIQTKFHPETDPAGNAFNIIAEIPGTDLANEVVIMGAHFDTYPYATGATDNTTGSAAMIEAVRVIQALGLKPRRTIRVALWAAEEQGLLGSRDYVNRHYFDAADQDAETRARERAGVLQPRQRHRPHSRHLGPGQRRRDEDRSSSGASR